MTQIKWAQVNAGSLLLILRSDGNIFCAAVQSTFPSRKMRDKTPRQIRYVSYCEWALKITKIKQEDVF